MDSAHGGNIYDFPSRELLDFSSNINPAGPPKFALAAAADALTHVNRYPDARQSAVREAFSRWLGVPPDGLVFGNGASELIRAVIAALKPARILVTPPTFSEYESCALSHDVPVKGVPSNAANHFAFDVEGIGKIFSKGDLLMICQPNNPTGVAWKDDELRELVRLCSTSGGHMLVDECFINLAHPSLPSCMDMVGGRVIVLRALTKDFAAPGLRVGFLAAAADTARAIRKQIQPWPLNCIGEAFAIACARNPEPYLSNSAIKIATLRDAMTSDIAALGFSPNPSAANFILVRSLAANVGDLHDLLLERSILIRKCANFPPLDDSYFRVAVRSEEDNAAFLSGLASIASR
jgi:threonine-phosphate decarboxylase